VLSAADILVQRYGTCSSNADDDEDESSISSSRTESGVDDSDSTVLSRNTGRVVTWRGCFV